MVLHVHRAVTITGISKMHACIKTHQKCYALSSGCDEVMLVSLVQKLHTVL